MSRQPRPIAHLAALAAAVALATTACTTGPTPEPAGPAGSEESDSTAAAPSTTSSIGDGTPLLGRPTSWSMLIGSADQNDQPLTQLDLDSGTVTTYTGVSGAPVAAVRGRLVLQQTDQATRTARLRIVPLADPSARPIEIGPQPPVDVFLGLALPMVRGQGARLWIYHEADGRALWSLVDLEDGATSNAIAVGPADGPPPVAGGGPDVVSAGGSGVYRLDDDGYRLLGPGAPVAISDGAILTRTCTPPVCTWQWIDEQDGEEVERPTPGDRAEWWTLVTGSDRFLVGVPSPVTDQTPPEAMTVFDARDGQEINLTFASRGGVASSPDSRYLAFQSPDGIEVYDADLDQWFDVPVAPVAATTMAFIPTI